LETKVGLKKIYIPVDAADDEPRGFFFASENAWTADRLLILIHGSGVVRAGQWSRKLIINEDINTGSQIPYILDAFEAGFGVVVTNTNLNLAYAPGARRETHIRGSEEPVSHAIYVWDNFVRNAKARHIGIVAHSAGGYVTVNLAHEQADEFRERVFAVAFTDSVHSAKSHSPCWEHILKVARNWITSRQELGEKEKQRLQDVECVSAGTLSHEQTSASAFEDIRRYIQMRYKSIIGEESGDTGEQSSTDRLVKKLDLSTDASEEGDSAMNVLDVAMDGDVTAAMSDLENESAQKIDNDSGDRLIDENAKAQKSEL